MKFLVIGDYCRDAFIYGNVNRLSPEAPIPIFTPTRIEYNIGMAGNVVNNLESLVEKHLPNSIVNSVLAINDVIKSRYVDDASNHYFIRVDEGENLDRLKLKDAKVSALIADADCIVISDYNKGFVAIEDVISICKQKKKNAVVFLDTKKKVYEDTLYFIDFIKFNKVEYEAHNHLLEYMGGFNKKIIVTKGGEGVEYNGEKFEVDNVVTMDVSGAGDTFLAGLAVKYMETRDIREAIKFANQMASMVVKKRGVATI